MVSPCSMRCSSGGSAPALILYLDGLPARTFRWSMLGATALTVLALYGLAATQRRHQHRRRLLRLHVRPGDLGLARDELPDGLRHRLAPRGLPRRLPRLAPFLARDADHPPPRARDRGDGRADGGADLGRRQPGRHLDLPGAVGDAASAPSSTSSWACQTSPRSSSPSTWRTSRASLPAKPMNLLFPVSVTGGTIVACLLIQDAAAAETGSFDATAFTFVGALLALAVIEHWFLVLPIPDAALWSWGLRSRGSGSTRPTIAPTTRRTARRMTAPAAGLGPVQTATDPFDEWEATMNYEGFFRVAARRPSPGGPLPGLRRARAPCRRLPARPPLSRRRPRPR